MSGSLVTHSVAPPESSSPIESSSVPTSDGPGRSGSNSEAQAHMAVANTPIGRVEFLLKLGIPDRLKFLEALEDLSPKEKTTIRTNQGYMDQIEARMPGDMFQGACERVGYRTDGDDFEAFAGREGSTKDPDDVAEVDRLHEKGEEMAKATWGAWAGRASAFLQTELKTALPEDLETAVDGSKFSMSLPPEPPSFSVDSPKFGARFFETRLGEDATLSFMLDDFDEGHLFSNVSLVFIGPLEYEWFDDEMQFGVSGDVLMPDPVALSFDPRMFTTWGVDAVKLPRALNTSHTRSRWSVGA